MTGPILDQVGIPISAICKKAQKTQVYIAHSNAVEKWAICIGGAECKHCTCLGCRGNIYSEATNPEVYVEPLQLAIDQVLVRLRQQEAEVIETKKMVNGLRKMLGQPAMFTDLDVQPDSGNGNYRRDQFYGQALAKVVREILVSRKAGGQGPASVNEIYDSMIAGGYKFETANEDNSKRGLRISLSKNSTTFHKLPTGLWGLLEWYPNVKETKPAKGTPDAPAASEGDDEFDMEAKEKEANKTKEAVKATA